MISKKMTTALNGQINKELHSSFLYLAMSSYCQQENLGGFAAWLALQAKEEHGHAMKFYQYMQEQGAAVEFQAIEAPPAKFGTMQKLFTEVLAHEQFITRSIHGLMDLAVKESDYATQGMLQWFVKEQVEEEASAGEALARITMAGSEPRGVLIIDREMARRKAD